MADAGIGEAIAYVASALAETYGGVALGTWIEIAAVAAAAYQSYEAGVRERDAYNASLKNRYVMQRTSTGQRALVLGRARTSGPIAFMQSYGTNQATLAIVVVLAGHQCDAIEQIYFNDQVITTDPYGNVNGSLTTEHFSASNNTPLNVTLSTPAQRVTLTAVATYVGSTVTLTTVLNNDGIHLTISGMNPTGVCDIAVTYLAQNSQYATNHFFDQQYTTTAVATSGTYTFPAASSAYSLFSGVLSPQAGGAVSASSIVVVQSTSAGQTALSYTTTLDSNGNALTVSWSGATVGAEVWIAYQAQMTGSHARVRSYLGAAGQTADAGLISSLPGIWTTAHVGNGLCYLVCEFDYDSGSFAAGVPNVSATVRGALLYDPRTSATAWSNNPAVMAMGYWTHPLGANQSSSAVDTNSIIAAANICDTTQVFNIGIFSYTQPTYRAGIVATKDAKPSNVLTDLCMAMGGRWVISGNALRVKAGAYTSPVAAIDDSWLTSESAVELQPLPPRQSLFNAAQGTFCDETNEFRAVMYPKQINTGAVTTDGRELDLDITYQAVTNNAQAQYLTACAIRYNRAGMSLRMSCNLRAFPLEVFDVVTVTIPRFGFSAQTFEVTDTTFSPEGLVNLTLKYIASTIWNLDNYYLPAYAPRTNLPTPWNVAIPVLGTPVTGLDMLLMQADGTMESRIYVPISGCDSATMATGYVDVAYLDAATPLSAWNTITVSGNSAGAYLAPVQDGHTYIIKARARNSLTQSGWSAFVTCLASANPEPASDPTGLASTVHNGVITWTWNNCPDIDYSYTEVQIGGTAWGVGTTILYVGKVNQCPQTVTVTGSYQAWVKHFNRSGTPSTNAETATQVVVSTDLPGAGTTSLTVTVYQSTLTNNSPAAPIGGNETVTGNIFVPPTGWSATTPENNGTMWASTYTFITSTPSVAQTVPSSTATCVLLMHFEGSVGGTVFADDSPNAWTITASGSATTAAGPIERTTDFWHGQTALTCPTSGSFVTVPHNVALDISTNDFAIELWYCPIASAAGVILTKGATSGAYWNYQLTTNSTGNLVFQCYDVTHATLLTITSTSPLPTLGGAFDGFSFIEVGRQGSVLYMNVNGTLQSLSMGAITTLATNTDPLLLGNYNSGTASPMQGYLGELRITDGLFQAYIPLTRLTSTTYTGWSTPVAISIAAQNIINVIVYEQALSAPPPASGGSYLFSGPTLSLPGGTASFSQPLASLPAASTTTVTNPTTWSYRVQSLTTSAAGYYGAMLWWNATDLRYVEFCMLGAGDSGNGTGRGALFGFAPPTNAAHGVASPTGSPLFLVTNLDYAGVTPGYVLNSGTFVANSAYDFVQNDVIGMAINNATGAVWVRKNGGSWIGGGDPVAQTSPTATLGAGGIYFPVMLAYDRGTGYTGDYNMRMYVQGDTFQTAPPTGYLAYGAFTSWSASLPSSGTLTTWACNYTFVTNTPGTAVNGPTVDPISLIVNMSGAANSTQAVDTSTVNATGSLYSAPTGYVESYSEIVTSGGPFSGNCWRAAYQYTGAFANLIVNFPRIGRYAMPGDFTIEAWIKAGAFYGGSVAAVSGSPPGGNGTTNVNGNWYLGYGANGGGGGSFIFFSADLWISTGGIVQGTVLSSAGSYHATAGAWHHVAVTRQGNTLTMWVDGVSQGVVTLFGGGIPAYSISLLGPQAGPGSAYGNNYMQTGDFLGPVRINVATALYTATFTPPTAIFPTGTGGAGWSGPVSISNAGLSGSLSANPATVQADYLGNVSSWTSAGGTFSLASGGISLAGVQGIVFSVVSSTGGMTIAINASTGVYSVTAMTSNTGTAILQAVYNTQTIQLTYTLNKILGGVPAYTLTLSPPTVTLISDTSGTVNNYSTAVSNAVVTAAGVNDNANWTFAITAGPGVTAALSSNQVSVTAMTGSTGYVKVTATGTGTRAGLTASATFNLAKTVSTAPGGGVQSSMTFTCATHGSTTAYAGIKFMTDGTIQKKNASNVYVAAGNWYLPTTTGIGSSYWVDATLVSGPSLSTGTLGSWQAMSSAVAFEQQATSGGLVNDTYLSFQISSASGGTPVVGSGNVEVLADTS